jgi:CRP-like cAMP-binding protein
MLLGGALLQWVWSLWSPDLAEAPRSTAPGAELAAHLAEALAQSYARLVGAPAARALRRHAGLADGGSGAEAEAALRLLVEQAVGDVGTPVGRRLLAGVCQSLPWEQQLEATEELGLVDWLDPSPPVERETLEELLAGSLLFSDVPAAARAELASRARLRRWEEGAAILRAGAPAHWLHLLLEGSAAVWGPEAAGRHRLAILSPGATFGFQALSPGGVYTASVTAAGPATTVSLHRHDLAEVAADHVSPAQLTDLAAQVSSLRLTSLFHELAEAQVVAFLARARRESYEPGAAIVRQGERGDRFFAIRSGQVAVVREAEGETETVAVLGPGDCFGELAVLFGVPRTATVIAQEQVEALTLDREDFLRLFPVHERGTRALLHLSVSRVLKLGGPPQEQGTS